MIAGLPRSPPAPAAACALLLAACASTTPATLTPEGARVHVSSGEGLEDCTPLGDFISGGGGARPLSNPWAESQVRNLAAKRGATDVVMDRADTGRVFGRGYRCP